MKKVFYLMAASWVLAHGGFWVQPRRFAPSCRGSVGQ